MIIVLADDFTGAAEIGGVAVRHGLTATVVTDAARGADIRADLLVIDTETRALGAAAAAAKVHQVLAVVADAAADWLYKKVDSVLRGPVLAEISAVLDAWHLPRALLVPANPELGRVIRDGRYLVGGRPIDETEFARDPHNPVSSALVVDMLGSLPPVPVSTRVPGERLAERGVIVGEAESTADVAAWAAALNEGTLPAGAASFFTAVLQRRTGKDMTARAAEAVVGTEGPGLFVSGSASVAAREFATALEQRGRTVVRIPVTSRGPDESDVAAWAEPARRAIDRDGIALLTVGAAPDSDTSGAAPHELVARTARSLVTRARVETLYVEGGATASALAALLGWTRFEVIADCALGVVALQPDADAPRVVVKPGSYRWPAGMAGRAR